MTEVKEKSSSGRSSGNGIIHPIIYKSNNPLIH